MLLLLTTPWLLCKVWSLAKKQEMPGKTAAAIGLGILFVFTAVGHFIKTEAMAQMIPEFLPVKIFIVYLTGVLELGIAASFFFRITRVGGAWLAVVLLLLFLPVNIYAAINHIPMGGHAWGPVYLLIRIPLQLVILVWIYGFLLKKNREVTQAR